jgi:hypothetical protein
MAYENLITQALGRELKNPILDVLRAVKLPRLLRQSGFIKKEGAPVESILLHFIYMLVMNHSIPLFVKRSDQSFQKDAYYRFLQDRRYHWHRLLQQITLKLISKVKVLHRGKRTEVMILDDTVETKRGKQIEGVCDHVRSNKEGRAVRGLNMVSLTYNDGYSNFMIDFALKFNKHLRIATEYFKHQFYHTSETYHRRHEGLQSKLDMAISMVHRALKAGFRADYLLVDSWYAKPVFIKAIKTLKLHTIARIANNPKIWQFEHRHKTLERLYRVTAKTKAKKQGRYNSIRYTYCSVVVKHKNAGRVKIVFIKTQGKLIPLLSTDVTLTDERIIELYKKRWNIEQGYKELREHFGFGKEENRIYEALIARITLSLLSYNIVSYINRINHEPQTLGGLFKDLECELTALAISMEQFLQILANIADLIEEHFQDEKLTMFLGLIVRNLRVSVRNELDFRCES